jgi:hypothetical protein
VLYNLAKVALEMGDRRCALGYLRSYLQMDLTSVPEGQVKKARDALKALETDMPDGSADGDASCSTHAASTNSGSTQFGRDAASPSPNDAAVRRASAGAGAGAEESSPVNSGPAPAQGDIHTPSTIVAPTAAAPASVAPTPAGRRIPLESALLHVARPSPLPAALLMGTGISLLLGGVGVLLWSDGVHSELQSERTRLIADEPPQPTTLRALDDALAYERRVGENQAGFDSVQHLDVVGWTLVGVGAACAATGTWLFVNPPRGSARWTVSRRGLGVSW